MLFFLKNHILYSSHSEHSDMNVVRLRRFMIFGFGIGSSIVTINTIKLHQKNQHQYHKELINRIHEVYSSDKPTSGIYLHIRPPFPQLGSFSYLLPYHWSLSIVPNHNKPMPIHYPNTNAENNVKHRHVGLQRSPNQGIFGRKAVFGSHLDDRYQIANTSEYIIPIECWIEYKTKYGHYPGDENTISQELLNEFTITHDELKSNTDNLREFDFGKYINGEFVTCRSVTLEAIHYASHPKIDA